MTPLYRYCWRDQYYGRICRIIERTSTNRSKVQFVDNGEIAIVNQMGIRLMKVNHDKQ